MAPTSLVAKWCQTRSSIDFATGVEDLRDLIGHVPASSSRTPKFIGKADAGLVGKAHSRLQGGRIDAHQVRRCSGVTGLAQACQHVNVFVMQGKLQQALFHFTAMANMRE